MAGQRADSIAGQAGAPSPQQDPAAQPARDSDRAAIAPVAGGAQSMMPPAEAGPSAAPETDWPADCEQRFVFKAHGKSDAADASKYAVPPGEEHIASFFFDAPWDGAVAQLLQSRERLDNRTIVHHWMLYTVESTSARDGEVRDETDLFVGPVFGAQYLLGGVPGATNLTLPETVGLRLSESAKKYKLEIHYFNATSETQLDGSGIEICVTNTKRPNDAAAHWLGTLTLDLPAHAKTDVVTTCRPVLNGGESHIMFATPHMHMMGAHAKAVVTRADGQLETLLDKPYVFKEQQLYRMPLDGKATDLVLKPGDTITTTCTFDNATDKELYWGESSTDEMCFLTLWAWPAGSINDGAGVGTSLSLPADQSCIER